MKATHSLLIGSLALASLLTGCVGTGPNTQQGAVGGAALGALAGAIIGNNSGSHNALAGAAIGGVVGGLAGGTLGNAVDQQRGTLYTSEAEATTRVVVTEPPPPPQVRTEIVTVQPAPSTVWVGGYYAYAGHGYEWVPGHWENPPHRHRAFVPPHWSRRGGGYVYIQGYWR